MDKMMLVMPINTAELVPGWKPYTGSIVVKADCCGRKCYLGPNGQAKVRNDKLSMICAFCAAKAGLGVTEHLGNTEQPFNL